MLPSLAHLRQRIPAKRTRPRDDRPPAARRSRRIVYASIDQRGAVHILTADVDVNPVIERYIDRGIGEAERTDARAVVIQLDTPGGLSTSMEHIVQRIQRVEGAGDRLRRTERREGCVGGHIHHDVSARRRDGARHKHRRRASDRLERRRHRRHARRRRSRTTPRLTPEASPKQHGRNADWAEAAVPQSVSAPTSEAVDKHIVDYARDGHRRSAHARPTAAPSTSTASQVTLAGLAAAPRVSNDMTHLRAVAADRSATPTSHSCCSRSADWGC